MKKTYFIKNDFCGELKTPQGANNDNKQFIIESISNYYDVLSRAGDKLKLMFKLGTHKIIIKDLFVLGTDGKCDGGIRSGKFVSWDIKKYEIKIEDKIVSKYHKIVINYYFQGTNWNDSICHILEYTDGSYSKIRIDEEYSRMQKYKFIGILMIKKLTDLVKINNKPIIDIIGFTDNEIICGYGVIDKNDMWGKENKLYDEYIKDLDSALKDFDYKNKYNFRMTKKINRLIEKNEERYNFDIYDFFVDGCKNLLKDTCQLILYKNRTEIKNDEKLIL